MQSGIVPVGRSFDDRGIRNDQHDVVASQMRVPIRQAQDAVLQPGPSQPEVMTLPVSAHKLASQFQVAAAAVLQPGASQPEVVTHPFSAELRAPWIAQQPADLPTGHASSGRTPQLAAASVDAASSQREDTRTIAVQPPASSLALVRRCSSACYKNAEVSRESTTASLGKRCFSNCDRHHRADAEA